MIYNLYDKSNTDGPDLPNPLAAKVGEIIEAVTSSNLEPKTKTGTAS
jgi:hypothetical protein